MEPEIARRCSTCGAAIRHRAAFCPQCGQALRQQPDSELAETHALRQPSDPELAETQALRQQPDSEVAETQAITEKAPNEKQKKRSELEVAQTVALDRSDLEPALPPVRRTTALRGSTHAENVRERVERIRKVSHVVLDQAAYDPSVRFLLVAALFLILFVILLVANRVLG